MKKVFLILLLAIPLFAQTLVTESVKNSTKTALDSAAVFTGTIESVSLYNTIMTSVLSDKSGTLNIIFYVKKTNGQYVAFDTETYSYTSGTTSTYTVSVKAPFYKVVFTNGLVDQTYLYITTMLHAGQPLTLDSSGGLVISGSTSNGALETTQLLVKKVLQAARPSGKAYYSNLEGDFTATPVTGATGKVAISGLPFTLDAKDVVYAAYKRTAGDWTYLGFEPTAGTGDTIIFSGTSFVSTDQLDIVIVNAPKTEDKSNDANKSLEQSPLWARYQIDEIYDGTNVAAATNYYPSATGASMDGYKNLSFTGKLIDADNTTTVTIEATNDEDATNADWIQVYGYDSKGNAIVNSVAATSTTTTFAWDFDDFNYQYFRVKVVTGDATNTIIIKQRRTY